MTDIKKMENQELEQVAGGNDGSLQPTWKWVTVSGTKNYLALRPAPASDEKNEIGMLHNGDLIQIRPDVVSGAYVWAYASNINKEGWVNASYVR